MRYFQYFSIKSFYTLYTNFYPQIFLKSQNFSDAKKNVNTIIISSDKFMRTIKALI